ncbi:hypothetical protein PHLCEN_2v13 [Hermanssonia centrifuga]|uniref:Uncharacterized protein n=1 Tax=Hermanssonia centrifuga TaxID=98765 RepID=A0A2R6S7B8_9APHY|nr:hypothetical protein PHLCEN_2v13 [Hermanssonia centrifuga]
MHRDGTRDCRAELDALSMAGTGRDPPVYVKAAEPEALRVELQSIEDAEFGQQLNSLAAQLSHRDPVKVPANAYDILAGLLCRIYDIYKLNDSNYQQMETNLHALLSVLKLHPPLSQDLICTQIYRVVPSTPLADTESLSGDTLVDTGESLYLDEDPTYSSLLALAYVYQDVFNPLR